MNISFSKNIQKSERNLMSDFPFLSFYYLHVYCVFGVSEAAPNLFMTKSFDLQVRRG